MPYAWLKVTVPMNPDVLAILQARAGKYGLTLGGYFGLLARRDAARNGHKSKQGMLTVSHELPANAIDELRAEAGDRETDVATLCKEILEVHAAARREERRLLDALAAEGAERTAHA